MKCLYIWLATLVSFPRFQDNPRALSHFKVIVGIDEDRFFKCCFADFVVANSGE